VQVLRLVCSCLRNAPASDTWDLSSLLVNGSPVSQATVEAVLSVIYSSIGALDYEMDRSAGQYSLSQLLDMLLFADAVGCSKAVLGQLAGLMGSTVPAELEVKLTEDISSAAASSTRGRGGGRSARGGRGRGRAAAGAADTAADTQTVVLHLENVYSTADADDDGDHDDDEDEDGVKDKKFVLKRWSRSKHTVVCHLSEQQDQQLQEQAAQQLEALLYVGFKMDLQQLLQPALRFLQAHAESLLSSLIKDQADTLFTQRMLAAAAGASGAELLTRACVQRILGPGFGIGSMFADVEDVEGEEDYDCVVSFEGTLLHDFDDFCKGTRMVVHFDRDGTLLMRAAIAELPSEGEEDGSEPVYAEYSFGAVLGPKHTLVNSGAQGSA
jgi:hypothetical protein